RSRQSRRATWSVGRYSTRARAHRSSGPLAAEPGGFERQLLEGAGGRVEGVVQGVARDVRRDAADQARPLLGADGARGPEAEVADLRLLKPVVGADAHLLEREPPERAVAPGRHRVGELRADPGPAAGELVELEPPAERVRPDGERRLAEVGLGEGQDDVAPQRADVAVQHEPLSPPEEVVLLDAEVEEQRVGRAEPRARAERAGLPLLHVDHDVHAVVGTGSAGGDVDLLEEPEALQRLAALAELG